MDQDATAEKTRLDAWVAETAAAAIEAQHRLVAAADAGAVTEQDLAEAVRARQVHGIARNLRESQPD